MKEAGFGSFFKKKLFLAEIYFELFPVEPKFVSYSKNRFYLRKDSFQLTSKNEKKKNKKSKVRLGLQT